MPVLNFPSFRPQTAYNKGSESLSPSTRSVSPKFVMFAGSPEQEPPVQKKKAPFIGLTSGIACGKTFVLNLFKQKGVKATDVDEFVNDMWQNDEDLKAKTRAAFGDEVFNADGSVNRKKVGDIVFNPANADKKKLLESWTHPKVRERMFKFYEDNKDADLVVVEVPLLCESKMESLFDKVMVVYATLEQQLQRLMARPLRDGTFLTREQAQARIDSQMPLAEKIAKPGVIVIDNSGSKETTEQQIDAFIASVRGNQPGQ